MKVSFDTYANYSNGNYGVHALMFTDADGNRFWFSYKTLIAFDHAGGVAVIRNYWGPTTGKHLNAISSDKKDRLSQDDFDALYKSTYKRDHRVAA